jgi:hypothetical protein
MQVRTLDDGHEEPRVQSNNGSFFHKTFMDIGVKLKACNDTLGELQQLGISHDVQLPELVLVGDQSAGKSSLMSGLAGLNLPRSEGVCTRCPIHIRVSRNQEWSCRVSLQQDYAFCPPTDRVISANDVTPMNPFPPWKKQPRVLKEFKTIFNKEEIEEVLRWAQIAILNHSYSHELYIPGSGKIAQRMDLEHEAEKTLAKFSPNTVALEIKGPDLPDLSFYDMPGIFRNASIEADDYLVSVVENLARTYIQHPGAIIIWAVPMNVDPETSSTFTIIRQMKAAGRTIGVMTKADLLPEEGNHSQWLAMLRGERHKIGLDYFITTRPTDKSLDEQTVWENRFFARKTPKNWPEAFSKDFSERYGVEQLKKFLSARLGEEFAKR